MKHIPMLFTGPMVIAKKEGRKDNTRRLKGLELINKNPDDWEFVRFHDGFAKFCEKHNWTNEKYIKCPYGQPGDLIWTRETFIINGFQVLQNTYYMIEVKYMDGEIRCVKLDENETASFDKWKRKTGKQSSLFMFKSLCRFWDKIESIRCERLQDIAPMAALYEGVEYWNVDHKALEGGEFVADFKNYQWVDDEDYHEYHFPSFSNSIDSFRTLWDSINAEKGLNWKFNPWVWVVKFSPTEKPTDL